MGSRILWGSVVGGGNRMTRMRMREDEMRLGGRVCVGRRREGERVKSGSNDFGGGVLCQSVEARIGWSRTTMMEDTGGRRSTASEHRCGSLRGWKGCRVRRFYYRPVGLRPGGGVDFGRGTTMMRAVARPGWERTPEPSFVLREEEAGACPPRRYYE